jgi:phytol kinase
MFRSPTIVPIVEPWQGLLLVPLFVLALVAGLRLLAKSGAVHPESVRKGLHIGGGLIALSFPWLFDQIWPLLVLTGCGVVALVAINVNRRFARSGLMAGMERKDEIYIGPIYFPIAVVTLFWLTRSNVLLYWIPILVLTFADALAALVGVRYGSVKYDATRGRKSLEGSTAFFLAAFFSVHVPLLLLTDLGRAETLLIGIMFGLLLAMVEAIAWSGLDNLFIPLAGYMLLEVYVGLDAEALGWRLIITAFLMVVALFARSQTWNDAALMLAILVGYLCANLGGFPWLVIALWAFVGVVISPPAGAPKRTIREVGAVSIVGLLWLALAHERHVPQLLAPFTGSLAAHLAMNGVARGAKKGTGTISGSLSDFGTGTAPARLPEMVPVPFFAPALFSTAWMFLPYLVLEQASPAACFGAVGATLGVLIAVALFACWLPRVEARFGIRGRWTFQSLLAAAGSCSGLAVFLANN